MIPSEQENSLNSKIRFKTGYNAQLYSGLNGLVTFSGELEPVDEDQLPVTFFWKRGEVPLENTGRIKISQSKNAIQLALDHVQRDDAGHYTLYAKTKSGDMARKDFELIVEDRSTGDDPPIFLRRLADLSVKVGTRTRLLVEIRSSTDVKVTWYRNDRRICENERIKWVNEGNFYCLEIAPITLDDGGQWMCMAENLGGRNSCISHLNVLVPKAYKSPEFVEELRAILTEQGVVSLECKVIGVPTPVLRWFKDSKEIKAGDVFALTANPDDPTSLGTYTCEAVNCMGKMYSSSKVHVAGRGSREGSLKPADNRTHNAPPPIFTTELRNATVKIGDPVLLGCQVAVPPWPKSVVWYNKTGRVETNENYRLIEDGLGVYMIEIKPSESCDEGEWKCVVTSNEGSVGISSCVVEMEIPRNYRKPRFMESLKAVLTEEGLVSFECKVVGFPTPQLKWFKDGHELKPGDVYQLTGHNSLGTYCCIARNCMGESSSTAVLTVEDIQNQLNDEERLQLVQVNNQPPKFLKGLKSCETKINEEFRFTVQVTSVPEPVFSWFRDDLPIENSERYIILKETLGSCHLDIRRVEFNDQAEWKCVATNDFGQSVTSCFLKLQIPRHFKKPRFLECLRAVLSEEGAVNLECKVIGVPQPVLKWYKDSVELKPGDIHRIITGQDGTCCLGTYTCEARNCMGVVASSASLLGIDDAYKAAQVDEIPKGQEIQRNISLSTINEERTSQMYDTPCGDITIDDRGDISFSFDGKEVSVSLYETPDLTEEEALQIVEMYADQISEHVTEQNVVELPPLRFVKETSTSGNLLMEAVVIDVAPDYFPPEEDLRTEADMDDISEVEQSFSLKADELALDRETEEYVKKTYEALDNELEPRQKKHKGDSLLSGDLEEYFSLSHRSEDDTETDLQTFASAKDHLTDSKVPELNDLDIALQEAQALLEADEKLEEVLQQPPEPKPRKRKSKSNEVSQQEEDANLRDISGEEGDGLIAKRSTPAIHQKNVDQLVSILRDLNTINANLKAVEEEVNLQSGLMMSAASVDRSLGIIQNVLDPISKIQNKLNLYSENIPLEKLFESIVEPLQKLEQALSVIEKCVEMDESGRTLVQRTSVCIVDSSGELILQSLDKIKKVVFALHQPRLRKEVDLIIHDMEVGIEITQDTIRSQALMQEAVALETAQHVSETIARMQEEVQTPTDIHALETVQSNLPEDAKDLKNVCRPVVKIQQALETIEQDLSLNENEENVYRNLQNAVISKLTEPIEDLKNEILAIERMAAERGGDQSLEQTIKFAILDSVKPPLYELQKGLELLIEQSPDTIRSANVLDSMMLPLQEIQYSLVRIGQDLESGTLKSGSPPVETFDNQKLLQSIAQAVINFDTNVQSIKLKILDENLGQSLTELKSNLSKVIENSVEAPLDKYNVTILENIKQPLDDINYCLRQIEAKSLTGSLNDLLDPLIALNERVKMCENILTITKQTDHNPNMAVLQQVRSVIGRIETGIEQNNLKLDEEMEAAESQKVSQLLNEAGELLAQKEQITIENLNLLENLHQCLSNIQDQMKVEKSVTKDKPQAEAFSDAISVPLKDIIDSVVDIQNEILNNPSNEENNKILDSISQPIQHIVDTIMNISQQTHVGTVRPISENVEALQDLTVPLNELKQSIETTTRRDQGKKSNILSPLNNLLSSVAQVIDTINVEPKETVTPSVVLLDDKQKSKAKQLLENIKINLIHIKDSSLEPNKLETLEKSIKEFDEFVNTTDKNLASTSSDYSSLSFLTTLNLPLHEIQDYISEYQMHHGQVEQIQEPILKVIEFIEKSQKNIESIQAPSTKANVLEELNRCVAAIQQIQAFKDQHDLSDASILKDIAEPIESIEQKLNEIQETKTLSGLDELSMEDNVSLLKTLISPIMEIQNTINNLENISAVQAQTATPILELFESVKRIEVNVLQDIVQLKDENDSTLIKSFTDSLPPKAIQPPTIEVVETESVIDPSSISQSGLQAPSDTEMFETLAPQADEVKSILLSLNQVEKLVEHDQSLIETIKQPLTQLQTDLSHIEENIKNNESTIQPIQELKANIQSVREQIEDKCVNELIKEITVCLGTIDKIPTEMTSDLIVEEMKSLSIPLAKLMDCTLNIKSNLSVAENSVQSTTSISAPLSDVKKQLDIISSHISNMKTNANQSDVVDRFVEPLEELKNCVKELQQKSNESVDPIQLSIEVSKLRKPIQELNNILIRMTSIEGEELISTEEVPTAEVLGPIKEMQKCLMAIQNQLIMEPDDNTISETTTFVESYVEPILELQRGLEIIETDVLEKPVDDSEISKADLDILRSIVEPNIELRDEIKDLDEKAIKVTGDVTNEMISEVKKGEIEQQVTTSSKEIFTDLVTTVEEPTSGKTESTHNIQTGVELIEPGIPESRTSELNNVVDNVIPMEGINDAVKLEVKVLEMQSEPNEKIAPTVSEPEVDKADVLPEVLQLQDITVVESLETVSLGGESIGITDKIVAEPLDITNLAEVQQVDQPTITATQGSGDITVVDETKMAESQDNIIQHEEKIEAVPQMEMVQEPIVEAVPRVENIKSGEEVLQPITEAVVMPEVLQSQDINIAESLETMRLGEESTDITEMDKIEDVQQTEQPTIITQTDTVTVVSEEPADIILVEDTKMAESQKETGGEPPQIIQHDEPIETVPQMEKAIEGPSDEIPIDKTAEEPRLEEVVITSSIDAQTNDIVSPNDNVLIDGSIKITPEMAKPDETIDQTPKALLLIDTTTTDIGVISPISADGVELSKLQEVSGDLPIDQGNSEVLTEVSQPVPIKDEQIELPQTPSTGEVNLSADITTDPEKIESASMAEGSTTISVPTTLSDVQMDTTTELVNATENTDVYISEISEAPMTTAQDSASFMETSDYATITEDAGASGVTETLEKDKLEEKARHLLRQTEERELTPQEWDNLQYILAQLKYLGSEVHETLTDAKIINASTADVINKIKEEAQNPVKKNEDFPTVTTIEDITADTNVLVQDDQILIEESFEPRVQPVLITGDTSIQNDETKPQFQIESISIEDGVSQMCVDLPHPHETDELGHKTIRLVGDENVAIDETENKTISISGHVPTDQEIIEPQTSDTAVIPVEAAIKVESADEEYKEALLKSDPQSTYRKSEEPESVTFYDAHEDVDRLRETNIEEISVILPEIEDQENIILTKVEEMLNKQPIEAEAFGDTIDLIAAVPTEEPDLITRCLIGAVSEDQPDETVAQLTEEVSPQSTGRIVETKSGEEQSEGESVPTITDSGTGKTSEEIVKQETAPKEAEQQLVEATGTAGEITEQPGETVAKISEVVILSEIEDQENIILTKMEELLNKQPIESEAFGDTLGLIAAVPTEELDLITRCLIGAVSEDQAVLQTINSEQNAIEPSLQLDENTKQIVEDKTLPFSEDHIPTELIDAVISPVEQTDMIQTELLSESAEEMLMISDQLNIKTDLESEKSETTTQLHEISEELTKRELIEPTPTETEEGLIDGSEQNIGDFEITRIEDQVITPTIESVQIISDEISIQLTEPKVLELKLGEEQNEGENVATITDLEETGICVEEVLEQLSTDAKEKEQQLIDVIGIAGDITDQVIETAVHIIEEIATQEAELTLDEISQDVEQQEYLKEQQFNDATRITGEIIEQLGETVAQIPEEVSPKSTELIVLETKSGEEQSEGESVPTITDPGTGVSSEEIIEQETVPKEVEQQLVDATGTTGEITEQLAETVTQLTEEVSPQSTEPLVLETKSGTEQSEGESVPTITDPGTGVSSEEIIEQETVPKEVEQQLVDATGATGEITEQLAETVTQLTEEVSPQSTEPLVLETKSGEEQSEGESVPTITDPGTGVSSEEIIEQETVPKEVEQQLVDATGTTGEVAEQLAENVAQLTEEVSPQSTEPLVLETKSGKEQSEGESAPTITDPGTGVSSEEIIEQETVPKEVEQQLVDATGTTGEVAEQLAENVAQLTEEVSPQSTEPIVLETKSGEEQSEGESVPTITDPGTGVSSEEITEQETVPKEVEQQLVDATGTTGEVAEQLAETVAQLTEEVSPQSSEPIVLETKSGEEQSEGESVPTITDPGTGVSSEKIIEQETVPKEEEQQLVDATGTTGEVAEQLAENVAQLTEEGSPQSTEPIVLETKSGEEQSEGESVPTITDPGTGVSSEEIIEQETVPKVVEQQLADATGTTGEVAEQLAENVAQLTEEVSPQSTEPIVLETKSGEEQSEGESVPTITDPGTGVSSEEIIEQETVPKEVEQQLVDATGTTGEVAEQLAENVAQLTEEVSPQSTEPIVLETKSGEEQSEGESVPTITDPGTGVSSEEIIEQETVPKEVEQELVNATGTTVEVAKQLAENVAQLTEEGSPQSTEPVVLETKSGEEQSEGESVPTITDPGTGVSSEKIMEQETVPKEVEQQLVDSTGTSGAQLTEEVTPQSTEPTVIDAKLGEEQCEDESVPTITDPATCVSSEEIIEQETVPKEVEQQLIHATGTTGESAEQLAENVAQLTEEGSPQSTEPLVLETKSGKEQSEGESVPTITDPGTGVPSEEIIEQETVPKGVEQQLVDATGTTGEITEQLAETVTQLTEEVSPQSTEPIVLETKSGTEQSEGESVPTITDPGTGVSSEEIIEQETVPKEVEQQLVDATGATGEITEQLAETVTQLTEEVSPQSTEPLVLETKSGEEQSEGESVPTITDPGTGVSSEEIIEQEIVPKEVEQQLVDATGTTGEVAEQLAENVAQLTEEVSPQSTEPLVLETKSGKEQSEGESAPTITDPGTGVSSEEIIEQETVPKEVEQQLVDATGTTGEIAEQLAETVAQLTEEVSPQSTEPIVLETKSGEEQSEGESVPTITDPGTGVSSEEITEQETVPKEVEQQLVDATGTTGEVAEQLAETVAQLTEEVSPQSSEPIVLETKSGEEQSEGESVPTITDPGTGVSSEKIIEQETVPKEEEQQLVDATGTTGEVAEQLAENVAQLTEEGSPQSTEPIVLETKSGEEQSEGESVPTITDPGTGVSSEEIIEQETVPKVVEQQLADATGTTGEVAEQLAENVAQLTEEVSPQSTEPIVLETKSGEEQSEGESVPTITDPGTGVSSEEIIEQETVPKEVEQQLVDATGTTGEVAEQLAENVAQLTEEVSPQSTEPIVLETKSGEEQSEGESVPTITDPGTGVSSEEIIEQETVPKEVEQQLVNATGTTVEVAKQLAENVAQLTEEGSPQSTEPVVLETKSGEEQSEGESVPTITDPGTGVSSEKIMEQETVPKEVEQQLVDSTGTSGAQLTEEVTPQSTEPTVIDAKLGEEQCEDESVPTITDPATCVSSEEIIEQETVPKEVEQQLVDATGATGEIAEQLAETVAQLTEEVSPQPIVLETKSGEEQSEGESVPTITDSETGVSSEEIIEQETVPKEVEQQLIHATGTTGESAEQLAENVAQLTEEGSPQSTEPIVLKTKSGEEQSEGESVPTITDPGTGVSSEKIIEQETVPKEVEQQLVDAIGTTGESAEQLAETVAQLTEEVSPQSTEPIVLKTKLGEEQSEGENFETPITSQNVLEQPDTDADEAEIKLSVVTGIAEEISEKAIETAVQILEEIGVQEGEVLGVETNLTSTDQQLADTSEISNETTEQLDESVAQISTETQTQLTETDKPEIGDTGTDISANIVLEQPSTEVKVEEQLSELTELMKPQDEQVETADQIDKTVEAGKLPQASSTEAEAIEPATVDKVKLLETNLNENQMEIENISVGSEQATVEGILPNSGIEEQITEGTVESVKQSTDGSTSETQEIQSLCKDSEAFVQPLTEPKVVEDVKTLHTSAEQETPKEETIQPLETTVPIEKISTGSIEPIPDQNAAIDSVAILNAHNIETLDNIQQIGENIPIESVQFATEIEMIAADGILTDDLQPIEATELQSTGLVPQRQADQAILIETVADPIEPIEKPKRKSKSKSIDETGKLEAEDTGSDTESTDTVIEMDEGVKKPGRKSKGKAKEIPGEDSKEKGDAPQKTKRKSKPKSEQPPISDAVKQGDELVDPTTSETAPSIELDKSADVESLVKESVQSPIIDQSVETDSTILTSEVAKELEKVEADITAKIVDASEPEKKPRRKNKSLKPEDEKPSEQTDQETVSAKEDQKSDEIVKPVEEAIAPIEQKLDVIQSIPEQKPLNESGVVPEEVGEPKDEAVAEPEVKKPKRKSSKKLDKQKDASTQDEKVSVEPKVDIISQNDKTTESVQSETKSDIDLTLKDVAIPDEQVILETPLELTPFALESQQKEPESSVPIDDKVKSDDVSVDKPNEALPDVTPTTIDTSVVSTSPETPSTEDKVKESPTEDVELKPDVKKPKRKSSKKLNNEKEDDAVQTQVATEIIKDELKSEVVAEPNKEVTPADVKEQMPQDQVKSQNDVRPEETIEVIQSGEEKPNDKPNVVEASVVETKPVETLVVKSVTDAADIQPLTEDKPDDAPAISTEDIQPEPEVKKPKRRSSKKSDSKQKDEKQNEDIIQPPVTAESKSESDAKTQDSSVAKDDEKELPTEDKSKESDEKPSINLESKEKELNKDVIQDAVTTDVGVEVKTAPDIEIQRDVDKSEKEIEPAEKQLLPQSMAVPDPIIATVESSEAEMKPDESLKLSEDKPTEDMEAKKPKRKSSKKSNATTKDDDIPKTEKPAESEPLIEENQKKGTELVSTVEGEAKVETVPGELLEVKPVVDASAIKTSTEDKLKEVSDMSVPETKQEPEVKKPRRKSSKKLDKKEEAKTLDEGVSEDKLTVAGVTSEETVTKSAKEKPIDAVDQVVTDVTIKDEVAVEPSTEEKSNEVVAEAIKPEPEVKKPRRKSSTKLDKSKETPEDKPSLEPTDTNIKPEQTVKDEIVVTPEEKPQDTNAEEVKVEPKKPRRKSSTKLGREKESTKTEIVPESTPSPKPEEAIVDVTQSADDKSKETTTVAEPVVQEVKTEPEVAKPKRRSTKLKKEKEAKSEKVVDEKTVDTIDVPKSEIKPVDEISKEAELPGIEKKTENEEKSKVDTEILVKPDESIEKIEKTSESAPSAEEKSKAIEEQEVKKPRRKSSTKITKENESKPISDKTTEELKKEETLPIQTIEQKTEQIESKSEDALVKTPEATVATDETPKPTEEEVKKPRRKSSTKLVKDKKSKTPEEEVKDGEKSIPSKVEPKPEENIESKEIIVDQDEEVKKPRRKSSSKLSKDKDAKSPEPMEEDKSQSTIKLDKEEEAKPQPETNKISEVTPSVDEAAKEDEPQATKPKRKSSTKLSKEKEAKSPEPVVEDKPKEEVTSPAETKEVKSEADEKKPRRKSSTKVSKEKDVKESTAVSVDDKPTDVVGEEKVKQETKDITKQEVQADETPKPLTEEGIIQPKQVSPSDQKSKEELATEKAPEVEEPKKPKRKSLKKDDVKPVEEPVEQPAGVDTKATDEAENEIIDDTEAKKPKRKSIKSPKEKSPEKKLAEEIPSAPVIEIPSVEVKVEKKSEEPEIQKPKRTRSMKKDEPKPKPEEPAPEKPRRRLKEERREPEKDEEAIQKLLEATKVKILAENQQKWELAQQSDDDSSLSESLECRQEKLDKLVEHKQSRRLPQFETYLMNSHTEQGAKVKLMCNILGKEVKVIWKKDNKVIENGAKFIIKETDDLHTLEIMDALPSDSGEYQCIAYNSNGEMYSAATVDVYEPPPKEVKIPPTFTRSIRGKS